jgi:hypothetical protein
MNATSRRVGAPAAARGSGAARICVHRNGVELRCVVNASFPLWFHEKTARYRKIRLPACRPDKQELYPG